MRIILIIIIIILILNNQIIWKIKSDIIKKIVKIIIKIFNILNISKIIIIILNFNLIIYKIGINIIKNSHIIIIIRIMISNIQNKMRIKLTIFKIEKNRIHFNRNVKIIIIINFNPIKGKKNYNTFYTSKNELNYTCNY